MLARPFFWASLGSMALVAVACGSSDESLFNEADAGLGDASFTGGDSAPLLTDASADPDAFTACATDTQHAKILPLDLYLMVDTSDSMNELVTASQTKWAAVKAAITAFVQDGASAGIGVGVQFFPLVPAGAPATCTTNAQCSGANAGLCLLNLCTPPPNNILTPCDPTAAKACPQGGEVCVPAGQCSLEKNHYCINFGTSCGKDSNGFDMGTCTQVSPSTCTKDSCTASDYATPAAAVAALPGASGGLVAALGAKSPYGNTPTSAALTGAVTAAKSYASKNVGHTVVAVLATDGLPTECDTSISAIAGIASSAVAAAPSVKTFVIGVFAPADSANAKTNLDQIAAAGGTSASLIIQTGANVEQQFLTALNTIRGTALPCNYALPVPESGTPDYNKVNVEYTNGSGQKAILPYVKSSANCGAAGGWYYDVDPATGGKPTQVIVCANTCATLKAAGGQGSVEILQGCTTFTNIK